MSVRRGTQPASAGPRASHPRLASVVKSMRMLLAATCSAGVAVVAASPANAGAPSPTAPSEAAIAQYVEAVPSATGPVPVGEQASIGHAAALSPAVRAKVERTAGADARRAHPDRPGPSGSATVPSLPLKPVRPAPRRRRGRCTCRSRCGRHILGPARFTFRHERRPHPRPARPARSPRRPRRPVPADSCSSPSCSSR